MSETIRAFPPHLDIDDVCARAADLAAAGDHDAARKLLREARSRARRERLEAEQLESALLEMEEAIDALSPDAGKGETS